MALFQIYHFMGAGTIAAQPGDDGYLRVGISYLKPGDIYDPQIGLTVARQRSLNVGSESTKNAHKLLRCKQEWLNDLVTTMRYAEQCGIGDSLTLRECVNFNMRRVQERVLRILNDSAALQQKELIQECRDALKQISALARVG